MSGKGKEMRDDLSLCPSRALVQEPRDGRAPHSKRYWLAPHYVFMSQLNAYVRVTVAVKGKLPLCLIHYHAISTYDWGGGVVIWYIFDLGCRWKLLSVSRSDRFISNDTVFGNNWIGGWEDPTFCLNTLKNVKISCLCLANGRAVPMFVIITFIFLFCSGFYPILPFLSYFSLSFISQIRLFFPRFFLQLIFLIPFIFYLFSFLSFLTPQPFNVLLFFIPLFTFFLYYFLPRLLSVCFFFSRFLVSHHLYTPVL